MTNADDPPRTLTIEGNQTEREVWPMIFVSHPADRADYRPPNGVDLVKWLTEHNLLLLNAKSGEVRQADAQIARVQAVHTRFARSPQSYAYDKYYLAHSQQLYAIVILHTGDREDWNLYNRFLASFHFD